MMFKEELEKKYGEIIEVGDYSYVGGNLNLLSWGEQKKLRIGKFCSIADKVTVLLGGNHRHDWITTYPFNALTDTWPEASEITGHPSTKGDVVIENDVWVGYGATILSGVTIGSGSVIGAKSLVTKDIEPYSIVGGNPGKLIRKRFDEEIIKKLMKINWWNWDDTKIRNNISVLQSNNIELLSKIGSL